MLVHRPVFFGSRFSKINFTPLGKSSGRSCSRYGSIPNNMKTASQQTTKICIPHMTLGWSTYKMILIIALKKMVVDLVATKQGFWCLHYSGVITLPTKTIYNKKKSLKNYPRLIVVYQIWFPPNGWYYLIPVISSIRKNPSGFDHLPLGFHTTLRPDPMTIRSHGMNGYTYLQYSWLIFYGLNHVRYVNHIPSNPMDLMGFHVWFVWYIPNVNHLSTSRE